MKIFKIGLAATMSMTLALQVFAGVNLKNGNFYIAYTDIAVPGSGPKMEMTRTYNSKSTHLGWFGFGWGNIFETHLTPSPDGCVIVKEHGSGGKTRFCPKSTVDASAAAEKVVAAMRKKNTISDQNAKELLKRLKDNADLRHLYAKQFGVVSKVAAGTTLYSNERGMQVLKKTKDGYFREFSDGKQEYFNDAGQLTKITDKGGYSLDFDWKENKLASIRDNKAKQLFFEWYSNGRIKHIWSSGEKKAFYKFKGEDLVYSKDVAGNEHEYSYDKNHNLIKIVFNPSRKKGEAADQMVMEYEPKTFFISKITDRNGETTAYKYGAADKSPEDHYWTKVTKPGFDNKPVTNHYEYEIKTKADGSRYTYRIKTEINGIETETIYSECCSLPIKIKRGKHVTNFEYNADGLLTKKTSTRGDNIEITYDDKIKKITKVVNNGDWTTFQYDKSGNLQLAENKAGKKVKLIYNSKGRITKMLDGQSKGKGETRVLSFKYNSSGKPVEINMEKVGKINVAYDNYGEIKKVESKQGHKMALQVTQAFQNLLSIVKPAGVNLNM